MPSLRHEGLDLHYVDEGDGPALVLLHGLLWSSRMFVRLRRELSGYRVILLDLRGHGLSDRPTEQERYTWGGFASDVVALLDHLGLERAVVGGLSLGANVTLATALRNPERLAGMVVEMPVLGRAHDVAEALFGRLARTLEVADQPLSFIGKVSKRIPVPRRLPELAAIRDVAAIDPASAAAIIRGLLDEGLPPDDRATIGAIDVPALVIGHRRDPLHVLEDARDLAAALPDARSVTASSIFEFRMRPERLAQHLRRFLAEVYPADEGTAAGSI